MNIKIIDNINMKTLRGKYSKADIKHTNTFFESPSTSSQETFLVRNTDTSKDTNYPNKRYKFIKNIGDGSASVIYEALDNIESRKVIIKKIKKNECWRNELEVLKIIKDKTSDRILKILDYYESQIRSYIVTEFYNGFDLFEHVDLNAPYNEPKGILLIKEMAECIKECHDNNVIHLDIKCENYMVKTENLFEQDKLTGKIVLIDFGHAEHTQNIEKIKKRYNYGTIYYLCPEGYIDRISSSKSDIWSLAICMSLIFTGDYPFFGSDDEYYKNCINYKIYLEKEISSEVYNLMKKCLNPNPHLRPNIDEFLKEIEVIEMRPAT
jgi:serine/threonine protein kinase